MRTISSDNRSANGVVEGPDQCQFDALGPEEGQLMSSVLEPVTDVVIGRKLWQEWSELWPGADDPFGQWINPVRKHVISATLSDELDGRDISVVGGIDTVRWLFLTGLIDELTLTTHPVVTNQGGRLFDESVLLTRFNLLRAAQTSTGNAILTYALRPTE